MTTPTFPKDLPKLVRDLVPDRLRRDGFAVTTSRVAPEDMPLVLVTKLLEEVRELARAFDGEGSPVDEAADVLEVVDAICRLVGSADVAVARGRKRQSHGAFWLGVVLEQVRNGDKGPDTWTDEQFLRYCEGHSETELSMFSAAQVKRLLELADGQPPSDDVKRKAWWSLDRQVVYDLVAAARNRLKGASE